MQMLEEQIEKSAGDINEKIKQHPGEVAFFLRQFSVKGEVTGGFLPPSSSNFHYYESGIIKGEIQKNENPKMKRIDLPGFILEKDGEDRSHHYLWDNYTLPVDRRIEGFIESNRFLMSIDDLEGLKEGNLLISLNDLYKNSNFFLKHDLSNLKRTDILIGNEDVEKFLKERRIENYQELFDVLKNHGFVFRKIADYHYKEREAFGKEFILISNEIANSFRTIKAIEDRVMHARYVRETDQDGSNISGWDDSHRENIYQYIDLREKIFSRLNIMDAQLKKGKKLYAATNIPALDGKIVGFFGDVGFYEQSAWTEKSLIPDIKKTFEKIDSYLNEQQK